MGVAERGERPEVRSSEVEDEEEEVGAVLDGSCGLVVWLMPLWLSLSLFLLLSSSLFPDAPSYPLCSAWPSPFSAASFHLFACRSF